MVATSCLRCLAPWNKTSNLFSRRTKKSERYNNYSNIRGLLENYYLNPTSRVSTMYIILYVLIRYTAAIDKLDCNYTFLLRFLKKKKCNTNVIG